jgi:uncharacterized protein (TIRG00374 family)
MKKTVLTALKVLVSVSILAYIFTRVVDIRHLGNNLAQAQLSFFALAVMTYFAVQALSAYRWYLLLKPQGLKVSYPRMLSFYFLGMYFNFFLPSTIGGDVFRIFYLNKDTGRLSASTTSVFLDRDIGMGGLLLVGTAVASYGGTSFQGARLAPIFGLVIAGFLLANLALFYRPTYNVLHRLLTVFRLKRADEKVESLFESVNSYRGRWGLLLETTLISIGVQVGCVLVNVLSARAIGLQTEHGWLDFLVFVPTIGLISMVPLSVNGTGWREASYILLFQSAGASAEQAAALALLWLGAVVITSLPGGIIYVVRGARKEDKPPDSDDFLSQSDLPEAAPPSKLPGEEESVSTV